MSTHSIFLCSSLCKDTYPENHGGEFSNVLNQSLEFDDPNDAWTVALGEIFYLPDSWYNIRDGYNKIKVSLTNLPVDEIPDRMYQIYYDSMKIELLGSLTKTDTRFQWRKKDGIDQVAGDSGEFYDADRAVGYMIHISKNDVLCYSYKYLTYDKENNGGFRLRYSVLTKKRDILRWPTQRELEEMGGYGSPKAPRKLKMHSDIYNKECFRLHDGDEDLPTIKYLDVNVYGNMILDEEVMETCYIPPNQYPTVESLLAAMAGEIENAIKLLMTKYHVNETLYKAKKTGLWIWLGVLLHRNTNPILKLVQIGADEALVKAKIIIKIHFAKEIQFQLGFTEYPILDLGWITISNTVSALHPPDIYRNTLRSIWIFCDIVQPSHVGDKKLPLLRFLPVDTSTHQISYEVSSHLQFQPVGKNSIETIRVWLAEDERGIPLILSNDSYIHLIFQRVE